MNVSYLMLMSEMNLDRFRKGLRREDGVTSGEMMILAGGLALAATAIIAVLRPRFANKSTTTGALIDS